MQALISLLYMSVFILLASCSSSAEKDKNTLSMLIGKEVIIPDDLIYQINNKNVTYDVSDADFKIITYIDSAGCVPCRMKLSSWKEVIDEYKGIASADVDFLMILNADSKNRDLKIILGQSNFYLPIAFDVEDKFSSLNSLPNNNQFHTLLLDLNNNIIAVGNPVENPKIKDFYRRKILADNDIYISQIKKGYVRALGLVNKEDSINEQFTIYNNTAYTKTIQALIPSCDCIDVQASADSILSGKSINIKVKIQPDTLCGSFTKKIDILYNEEEAKETLTIYGFIY